MDFKKWTANRVEDRNRTRDNINKNLLEWDKKAEEGLISEFDINKREEWLLDLHHLDQLHRDGLKQKCRIRLAMEGDENSRLFHSFLKSKYAHCSIKWVHVNGVWLDSPYDIKSAALNHFAARFMECDHNRPSFCNPLFRRLSSNDAFFLESAFSLEEIKAAVWDCAGSKAPGPDGFNFNFIKTLWELIKVYFWNCI
ncbi:hypothetical protein Tco_1001274 [Tanacetum coccineum]